MTSPILPRDDDVSTMPELLARTGEMFPTRPAVVANGVAVDYEELLAISSGLAKAMLARGAGKGTRVGILFSNSVEWVAAFHAVTRIGGIAVPVNTFSTARELGWLLRHADIDTLLTCATFRSHDYLSRLEEIAPGLAVTTSGTIRVPELPFLRHVLVWGDGDLPRWCESGPEAIGPSTDSSSGVSDELLAAVESEVLPSDLAAVIYTSGTTSTPKGVVHTQGTIVRKSLQISRYMELQTDDRFYTNMPFFWVGGLMIGVLACTHTGAALHCTAFNDSVEILRLLADEKITRMTLFSPPVSALKQHPAYQADAVAHVRELRQDPAPSGLGMTETFGMHSLHPPGGVPADGGGMGIGTVGIERRIVDPETGADVEAGEMGELWVRGQLLMDGYYKRERAEVFEPDGFFRTSDQCRIREDGQLFWTGRLDDMIKSAGANVAPAEIEMVLMSFPEIKVAGVVGMDDPDRVKRVVAVVEPVEGAVVTSEVLTERLRSQLASYKVPSEIVIVEQGTIPVDATGKVLKVKTRALLESRSSGARSRGDTVTALPLVGDDATDPKLQDVFARIRDANGTIGNLYRVLGNAPAMLEIWIDFAWRLRFEASTSRHLRELAILRVAELTDTPYETAAHTCMAREAGVSNAQLADLSQWQDSAAFDDHERLVLEVADELTSTTAIGAATRARLVEAFGEERTVEIVLTIAFYSCVSRVLKGLAVPLELPPDGA